jgi:hypothetical protein
MGTTHNAKIPFAFFYFCLRRVNALPKMNILRLTLILILLQTHGFGQPLTGQVFILADDFSDDKCEAFGECDCCTSDIFFLSSDKFCYISRCISGDSYFTGAYSTDSSKLKLTFDKKYVVEITDEDYTVTKLETRTTEIKPAEFDITKCGPIPAIKSFYDSRVEKRFAVQQTKRNRNDEAADDVKGLETNFEIGQQLKTPTSKSIYSAFSESTGFAIAD